MKCIIVDDEPLAREAIQSLIDKSSGLTLLSSFNSANAATQFLSKNSVDLIFLDIQMPGISGIDFAKTIPEHTLVIFTTAFAEYALDSYEVEAIDYLIKPVRLERFQRAVEKAQSYHKLLLTNENEKIQDDADGVVDDYFFVKADRKTYKIYLKDILFIEGLKDYIVLQTAERKIITAMNVKTIHEQLPRKTFIRTSKSFIVNAQHITSFDNNTIYIDKHEVPIGNVYRSNFFDEFVKKKTISR